MTLTTNLRSGGNAPNNMATFPAGRLDGHGLGPHGQERIMAGHWSQIEHVGRGVTMIISEEVRSSDMALAPFCGAREVVLFAFQDIDILAVGCADLAGLL